MVIGVLVVSVVAIPYVAQLSENSASNGSTSSGPLGVFDEIFHPGAHRSAIVIEELKERKAQAPIPGGDEEPGAGQRQ